jgi:transglutaminase-like putative cysteine protease
MKREIRERLTLRWPLAYWPERRMPMRPTSTNMKLIAIVPAGLMLMLVALPSALGTEPTAASAAFTSQDPVVLKALALMQSGKFKPAEDLLTTSDRPGDAAALRARSEALEILHRTRIEYSLDAASLLAKVRQSVPDATSRDVERWAKQSGARYRIVDGQKFYFRREPSNIFLFCPEAKARRAQAGKASPESKWKLTDHLQTIIEEAGKSGQTEVLPVRHRITYAVTIWSNAPGIKVGSRLCAWLPYPQEYRQQRGVTLLSASPQPRLIAPAAAEGNPVGDAAQRTAYFEQEVTDPTQTIQFTEVFEYQCFAYYPQLDEARVQPLPANWNNACLGERPPHIVFAPALRRQAAQIVGKETNSLAKARKIFRWVSANVKWNAEDEYCTIPSFAVKGFTTRRGDCGVQNTVFITLCRIAGIPARWQSGWETKPSTGVGMHDWAEIYIAPWGWLPADASYGVQKSDDPRIADYYCGHQDSYRLIVNLDWGRALFPPMTALRSEPADLQRGEVAVDGRTLYFDQWDYTMKAERDPGPNLE